MKDWKAECDSLKGQIKELNRQLEYEIREREGRERRDRDFVDRFKDLLIDAIGRK